MTEISLMLGKDICYLYVICMLVDIHFANYLLVYNFNEQKYREVKKSTSQSYNFSLQI